VTTFRQLATEIGDLVERKNAAYGSSFAKSGAALRLLYPEGIKPEQLDDALLIARIWDKLQRIATDRDALGESPYRDIAGYGILGAALRERTINPGEIDAAGKEVPAEVSTDGVPESDRSQTQTCEVLFARMPPQGPSGDEEKYRPTCL